MKTRFIVSLIVFTITSCNLSSNQQIEISEIGKSDIKEVLTENNIEYLKKDNTEYVNFDVKLFGEKIDPEITTLYKPHYTIDWEKERAYPNIFFNGIPLKEPNLLTDKEGKIKILSATVGNTEPIEIRQLNIFNNEQVIQLKKILYEKYGDCTYTEENTYQGNIYFWEINNITIRLAIENECLCKEAKGYRPKKYDERPKGGRNGLLVIYYDIKPNFY